MEKKNIPFKKAGFYIGESWDIINEDKKDEWLDLMEQIAYTDFKKGEVELRMSINYMKMLELGCKPEVVATFMAMDVDKAIDEEKISPEGGYVVREIVCDFNKKGIDLAKYIPENHFISGRQYSK